MSVFGTRPNAIKMAPLIKELDKYYERIKNIVCIAMARSYMVLTDSGGL
jgi:UDP-N-acetylglucosamine 2-epimerase (non-hydrolysing)